MSQFSDITWIALAAVSGFGLIQILRALAINVRNKTMIHDLRVRVSELQVQQFHAQMVRHGIARSATIVETEADNSDTPDASTPDPDKIEGVDPISASENQSHDGQHDGQPVGQEDLDSSPTLQAA